MVELNELSIVLIVLMIIIIAAIVILGQRKKKKYQESAEKAKQQTHEFRAKSKAMPSKDAARYEAGKIIPSKKPFGRSADDEQNFEENEPYIANIDDNHVDPNQQELAFENEPSIRSIEKEQSQTDEDKVVSHSEKQLDELALQEAEPIKQAAAETQVPELRDIAQQVIENIAETSSEEIKNAQPASTASNSTNDANELEEENISQTRQRQALEKIMNSDRVEPKTFALIVMGQKQIDLTDIHQFMMANNLRHTHQGFYEYQDGQGKMVFQAVNMLKPGTFPLNPSLKDKTPGVMFILDLPTPYSTAPAAMHNFISVARKLANRTDAQVFNEEQHVVGEHYYHSLRDSALGYESQKLMQ